MPQQLRTLARVVQTLLILSTLVTLGILFEGFDAEAAGGWGGYFGSAAWCAAPYVFLVILNHLTFSRGAAALVFAASIILSLLGCLVLFDAFYWTTQADERTSIFFIPLYQWVGAILVFVVAHALTAVEKDKTADLRGD